MISIELRWAVFQCGEQFKVRYRTGVDIQNETERMKERKKNDYWKQQEEIK